MIAELESRAAIALTSSFLPKCTQFLQLKVAHSPPSKTSFHGALASTKQKKGRKSSSPTRGWAYEHFMVLWDEVFEHCCTDPVKATQIRNLSCKGVAKHGRGCVLVFQEVQTRPRGSGVGFTSKPPKASRRVPDFATLDYHAVYLPREFLVDPRKAPLEEDIAGSDDEEQPPDNVARNVARILVEKQGDGSNEIIDVSESQHNDSKMGIDDSGGKVLDIEEIIREAQDVYSFYSDDEDESDDATDDNDDSLLGLDDEEGDTNATDSLIILDDDIEKGKPTGLDGEEGDSTLHRDGRDAEYDMANDDDFGRLTACERFDNHESPLVILEEDDEIEPHVINSLSRDKQNEENLNANGFRMFVDESARPKHNCDDAIHCTQTNTKGGHGGNPNFDIECRSTSRLRNSDDCASVFQSGSGEEEIKGNTTLNIQVKGNSGAHAKCDLLGSIGTTGPIVEFLDESSEADTFKSSGLVEIEKGRQYQRNKESEDEEVQLATQQMLNACMRGMDRTRLMSLTANFDFEAERFRFGRKMAVIDMKTSDAGGEEPYNPNEEELVLLLHLRIDGKPAYGADVVVAYRDESQTIGVEQDSWKLRGKYRNIFS